MTTSEFIKQDEVLSVLISVHNLRLALTQFEERLLSWEAPLMRRVQDDMNDVEETVQDLTVDFEKMIIRADFADERAFEGD